MSCPGCPALGGEGIAPSIMKLQFYQLLIIDLQILLIVNPTLLSGLLMSSFLSDLGLIYSKVNTVH